VLAQFQLAPDFIHLNHGSYGAVPLSVQAEQDRLRAHIERDATGFFQDELPGALRGIAGLAAARFGGHAEDWVFCENATSAINGILASFPLAPDDELITTSHAYGAVMRAMRIWAGRRGARLIVAELPAILQAEEQVIEAVTTAFTARTRLLVMDHITSATAAIFPVKRLVDAAHAAGVAVLIDGAHAPGQIPLDVPGLGADWYTGNAHKWLFAPKGCGLLWTSPQRQALTRPAVLSHGSEAGYLSAFDWVGTRDVTPWLCLQAAMAAHERFGGSGLMSKNRVLADSAALSLAAALGGTLSAPASMRAAMASLVLEDAPSDPGLAARIRRELSVRHNIVVPVSVFAGKLWLRISAQIYNQSADYDRLALAWKAVRRDQ